MPPAPFTPSMQDSVPLFLEEMLVHTDLEPLVYEEWSGVVATDNLKNATNSTMPRIALGDALPKSLLRWFELVAPELLVPRVLAVDDMGELTVTTFVPGLNAMHAYLCLDVLATEHSVLSYAQLTVRMFRIPAPQCFGTSQDLNGPTLLQVLGSHIRFSLEHCFDVSESTGLQSFFDGLIDTRLREGLQSLIVEVVKDPTLSRFVPPHQNTRCNNLILETVSGEISGVVDWEYCGCLPAAMAAQYPGWIRPPIDESLQYRNPKDTFLHYTFELKAPTPIGS
ncbi:hypothetical protein F5877DRAFT_82069 [Lentinula edodes]|nr:hypothetical protein F5877DRAFT_82069 [Lentinula edodes]